MHPITFANDPRCKINRLGGNFRLTIGEPISATFVEIWAGEGSCIEIGAECSLGFLQIYAAPGATVRVGAGVGFNGNTRLLAHEPCTLEIGANCLISGDVDFTVSDMHPIYDIASGERINPGKDVIVGDGVWVGQRSTILKGAKIGRGSIIGASSTVTKEIPPCSLAVGSPARVVRQGVRWEWDLPRF